MAVTPTTEVMYLKGVGPQRAELLAKRGMRTFDDLLGYLPFRYEDRIHFARFARSCPGKPTPCRRRSPSGSLVRYTRGRGGDLSPAGAGRHRLARLQIFSRRLSRSKRFKPGQRIVLHGKAELDPNRPGRIEMINPEYELLGAEDADSTEVGRIVPIYEAIGGISSRMMRRIIYPALEKFAGPLPDPLPAEMLARYKFPSRRDAMRFVHFPPPTESVEALNSFRSPAHQRLIFEEFFFYQLSVAHAARKRRSSSRASPFACASRPSAKRSSACCPSSPPRRRSACSRKSPPTSSARVPMNRLLQGDVGSGKTIVALEAATIVIENGYQVALMAPTEILAVQHYLAARKIFARAGYARRAADQRDEAGGEKARRSSACDPARRNSSSARTRCSRPQVEFARLGLVIVDEQHRFGVLQRKGLMEKGAAPDVLVMTATPIPRTLSLTLYGDLDISVIDQMPPGRVPIETRWSSEAHLPGVWEFLRREMAAGRQAYVVYPVIEQSKSAESQRSLKAAIVEYERLQKTVFPNRKLGLLHGRMKSEEKEDVMERFRRGELDILVSTTVIEVGVDVPNATVMVIEHAERFGLSQLHQLRGRIGRGGEQGHLHPGRAENSGRRRARAPGNHGAHHQRLRDRRNGFEIARPRRIFRHAPARRTRLPHRQSDARFRTAGARAPRSARAGRISRSRARAPAPARAASAGMAAALPAGVGRVNALEPRMHTDEHGYRREKSVNATIE